MNTGWAGTKSNACIFAISALIIVGLSGCRSAFVETTIDNQTPSPIRLIEVDYPSASFGVGSIESHSKFNYHFKIQGSGAMKIQFTDAQGKLHSSDGPTLSQGQEGTLNVLIEPSGEVHWQPSLAGSH